MGKMICCRDKTGANKGTSNAMSNLPTNKSKRVVLYVVGNTRKARKKIHRI
jgi:hypothetical protein